MSFQLHYFEWTAGANIRQITATSGAPGHYGAYPSYYPSPSAGTNYPSTAQNIGWTSSVMSTFSNPVNIIPGSIGPVKYYPIHDGPFKGLVDSYQSEDSGTLIHQWSKWEDLYA